MIWILIVIAHVGYGTGATSAEFNDYQACMEARGQIAHGETVAYCFAKSSPSGKTK